MPWDVGGLGDDEHDSGGILECFRTQDVVHVAVQRELVQGHVSQLNE